MTNTTTFTIEYSLILNPYAANRVHTFKVEAADHGAAYDLALAELACFPSVAIRGVRRA